MTLKDLIIQLHNDASWRSFRMAQKVLREGMGKADRIALARFLTGDKVRDRADFEARLVRIAVSSDTSLDNLIDPLTLALLERGMFGIQYHSPFAQLSFEV